MSKTQMTQGWLLMLIVSLVVRSAGNIFLPAISYVAEDLKVDPSVATGNLSLYFFFLTISFIFLGPICERYSKQILLRWSVFLCVVGCLFSASAWNIHVLNIGRSVQAISAGLILLTSQIWIGNHSDKKNMMSRLAWFSIVVAVAPILAPLFGGYIADWLSWRYDFIFIVILCIPIAVMTYRWQLPPEPDQTGSSKNLSIRTSLIAYKNVLLKTPLVSLSFSTHWLFWAQSALTAFASFLFIRDFGVSASTLGVLNTIFVIGLLVGRFPTLYLQKKYSVRFVFLMNQFLVLISAIGLSGYYWLTGTHELVEVITFITLQAVGFSGLAIVSLRNCMLIGNENKGIVSGFFNFMNQGFSLLGVFSVQVLYGLDLSSVFICQLMANVCIVSTIIGTILFLKAYKTHKHILE